MNWLFFVIASAFLHALGNITEKITVSRYVNHKNNYGYMAILFLSSSAVSLIFFPFADLSQIKPILYLIMSVRIFIAITATYLWIKLMMDEEITRIIGVIFAYILVAFVLDYLIFGTKLTVFGYIGSLVLVSSAILMTYKPAKKIFLHRKHIIYLIILVLLWGMWGIMIKSFTYFLDTPTYIFFENISMFITGIALLASSPKIRQHAKKFIKVPKFVWANIFIIETVYVLGLLSSFAAYSMQKISVIVPFETVQPTFVFLIALFLSYYFPKQLKEETDKKTVKYKIAALVLLSIGVYLMVSYST